MNPSKGRSQKKTISISCIATTKHRESIQAIENTLKCIDISKIYWISDIAFPKEIDSEIINIKILPFNLKESFNETYSFLALKLIPEIVDTDYNLIVHYDGYAVNKDSWTDQFLNYDYIGAVWPFYPKNKNVGNGGFCLRSRKLYNALKTVDIKYKWSDLFQLVNFNQLLFFNPNDKHVGKSVPEDLIICQIYRKQLEEEYKIIFAPEKIANRFSIENNFTSNWSTKSFGFHGLSMLNYYKSVFPLIISPNPLN